MTDVFFIHDGEEPGALAMARDAALGQRARLGEGPAALARSHGWSAPVMTLGRGQAIDPGLRADAQCVGMALARRPTGGGWLLHLPGDLALTAVLRGPLRAGELRGAAELVASSIAKALGAFGLDARVAEADPAAAATREAVCFARIDREEVSVAGVKVAGVALARLSRAVLVQTAIPLVPEGPPLTAFARRWDTKRGAAAAALRGLDAKALGRRFVEVFATALFGRARAWDWPDTLAAAAETRLARHDLDPGAALSRGAEESSDAAR